MIDSKDDRSLGELFADLARESSTLLRQEVQLAKTELSQKVSGLSRDMASVAIGGLVAYAGLLAILAALIIGLATAGLPWWVAALLVGANLGVVAAFYESIGLANLGRRQIDDPKWGGAERVKLQKEWLLFVGDVRSELTKARALSAAPRHLSVLDVVESMRPVRRKELTA